MRYDDALCTALAGLLLLPTAALAMPSGATAGDAKPDDELAPRAGLFDLADKLTGKKKEPDADEPLGTAAADENGSLTTFLAKPAPNPGVMIANFERYPQCKKKPEQNKFVTSKSTLVETGIRPQYLIDDMKDGELKSKLAKCLNDNKPAKRTAFSIAHRGGGTLLFPEETKQSVMAGHRMGAGIQECDVTFTADGVPVCRHSQCDLHTTTNILLIPDLAKKCRGQFQPWAGGNSETPAFAECCTSDITYKDFTRLCGKMDYYDPRATRVEQYVAGSNPWQTTLFNQCGTLFSYEEFIAMSKELGFAIAPELKMPMVPMPFDLVDSKYKKTGKQLTIDGYREMIWKMLKDHKDGEYDWKNVYLQSFHIEDLLAWKEKAGDYWRQAFLLDDSLERKMKEASGGLFGSIKSPLEYLRAGPDILKEYKKQGIHTVAPPTAYLTQGWLGVGKTLQLNKYAQAAKDEGLNLITWSLERSPPVQWAVRDGMNKGDKANVPVDPFYRSFPAAMTRDGDLFELIDFLYRKVGVKAMFSDWSGTVTFYANCMGINNDRLSLGALFNSPD